MLRLLQRHFELKAHLVARPLRPERAARIIERRTPCIKAFPTSLDVRENALKFVQAVVAHDELSLASGRVLKRHLRA